MLGVEAVLPTGEIIRSGGRLVKDVAGYDLRRLLCGSEGTLAVMTELTLRLVPAPEASGIGMAYFPDLADAARAVSRVLASGVLPVTLEFLDQVCIGAVEDFAHIGLDTSAGALLIFGQDGDPAVIERDLQRMAEACVAEGATEVRIADSPAEAAARCSRRAVPRCRRCRAWSRSRSSRTRRCRARASPRWSSTSRRSPSATSSRSARSATRATATCIRPRSSIPRTRMRWPAPTPPSAEIFARAIELDGTITGEHGVGSVKLRYLEQQLGADHMALLRRIKAAFDPNGILNPGKLGS